MCIIGSGGFAHFAEYLTWLMGYETLCYALFDQRGLVAAISRRLLKLYETVVERILQFDRVKIIWGSDDMGFRSGTLISPADLREFVLPGHAAMARAAHAAGRPYLLHSCGKIDAIMDDLLDYVQIDGLHSFETQSRLLSKPKSSTGTALQFWAASTWTSSAGLTKRRSAAAFDRPSNIVSRVAVIVLVRQQRGELCTFGQLSGDA